MHFQQRQRWLLLQLIRRIKDGDSRCTLGDVNLVKLSVFNWRRTVLYMDTVLYRRVTAFPPLR